MYHSEVNTKELKMLEDCTRPVCTSYKHHYAAAALPIGASYRQRRQPRPHKAEPRRLPCGNRPVDTSNRHPVRARTDLAGFNTAKFSDR